MSDAADGSRAQRATGRLLGAAATFFAALPSPLAYGLADLATPLLALFTWLHDRRVAPLGRGMRRNLRIAFRETLTPQRSRRLWWSCARHLGWLAVDFLRLPLTRTDNVTRRVDLSAYPEVRALADEGRGVICVSGHIGVWELLGHVATLIGLPMTIVARPLASAPLDRVVTRIRRSGGQRVLPKWGVLWPLVRALRRGELIGVLADEDFPERPVFAPFLGTLAASSPAPAFLQRVTGAPIAVVSLERTARERYRLHLWAVIRPGPGDVGAETLRVTTAVNQALSRAILHEPAQWLWGSRRFQTRPPHEKPGPDGLPPQA